jgi:hypothetical protein
MRGCPDAVALEFCGQRASYRGRAEYSVHHRPAGISMAVQQGRAEFNGRRAPHADEYRDHSEMKQPIYRHGVLVENACIACFSSLPQQQQEYLIARVLFTGNESVKAKFEVSSMMTRRSLINVRLGAQEGWHVPG